MMNKLIINRYSTKPIKSLRDNTIVYKEPLELEIDFELVLKDYIYKGYSFTVVSERYDLDNGIYIYETKPIWVLNE